MKDFRLTSNFRLYAFLVSRDFPELAAELVPSPIHINNLYLLCATILQPVRDRIDCPLYICSGLRSVPLNDAVGGSKHSLHMQGKAADPRPGNPDQLPYIVGYIKDALPFAWGQLIWYPDKGTFHVALPHRNREKFYEIRRGL